MKKVVCVCVFQLPDARHFLKTILQQLKHNLASKIVSSKNSIYCEPKILSNHAELLGENPNQTECWCKKKVGAAGWCQGGATWLQKAAQPMGKSPNHLFSSTSINNNRISFKMIKEKSSGREATVAHWIYVRWTKYFPSRLWVDSSTWVWRWHWDLTHRETYLPTTTFDFLFVIKWIFE